MRLIFFLLALESSLPHIVFAQQIPDAPRGFFAVVERMVENSPRYRSALLETEAQKVNARAGSFSHWPSLSGSISHSLDGNTSDDSQRNQSSGMSISTSVPLYRFGADQATVDQSRINRQFADAAARRVRVEAEKETACALLDLVKLEKQISIEERIFRSRTAVLDKAEGLFKRGLLPSEELEKMRVDLGMADIRLSELRTNARLSRQKSELAFGGPMGEVAWAWDSAALKKLESWSVDSALARLLPTALEEVRFAVQRAESDVVVARSGTLPSVGLNGSVGKSFLHRPLSREHPAAWSVGVSATVPIFSRFENQSRTESALLLMSAARLKLQDKERDVRQQVQSIAATIRDRLTADRQRNTFLESARNNLAKARERFLAGRISSNDLSSDETRVSEVEQALINSEAALQQDVVQLCAVLTLSLPVCVSQEIH